MTAAEALRMAHDNGVRVAIKGADLVLEAERKPAAAVLETLRRHKTGIIALMAPDSDVWTAEDWLALFDERAGIAEYDGGLCRNLAEASAFACCIAEWMNRNPESSAPGRCLGCGEGSHGHDVLLPFGIENAGQAWLHARCRTRWHDSRKAQADTALTAMGISNRSIQS